jgi:hypothetical protein
MPLTPVKALEEVSGSWGSDFFQNLNFSELGRELVEICQTLSRFVTNFSRVVPPVVWVLTDPEHRPTHMRCPQDPWRTIRGHIASPKDSGTNLSHGVGNPSDRRIPVRRAWAPRALFRV